MVHTSRATGSRPRSRSNQLTSAQRTRIILAVISGSFSILLIVAPIIATYLAHEESTSPLVGAVASSGADGTSVHVNPRVGMPTQHAIASSGIAAHPDGPVSSPMAFDAALPARAGPVSDAPNPGSVPRAYDPASGKTRIEVDGFREGRLVSGHVVGFHRQDLASYRVVVYVRTDDTGVWYIHPYAAGGQGYQWTTIDLDGRWTIQSVKHLPFRPVEVAALLVPASYEPPAQSLFPPADERVIAWTTAATDP